MGSCLSKNGSNRYVQQAAMGSTTHTPIMGHTGMVIQQGGMPVAAPHQQLQPNWVNNQQARNSLPGANNPTMVSGLNQGRPNQPNQYTPNPQPGKTGSNPPLVHSGVSLAPMPGGTNSPANTFVMNNGSTINSATATQHRQGTAGSQHKSSTGGGSVRSSGGTVHGHQGGMPSGTPGMNNRDSPSRTNKNVFIAMFDYTCQTDDDLPFKKGDLLEVESTMGEWWMATHKANGKRGYIPSNYVESYRSHRAEPWFMEEITRLSAECMLRECAKGTFLVRPAESRSNEFSLSVKDNSEVKHYRIRMNDEGMLFIAKRSTFPNLVQLVEHYKQHCDGLCVKLVASIEQNEGPVRTLQSLSKSHEVNWVISLKDLQFGTKLGSGQFGEVFRGSWNGNKEVAIKTLKQGTMDKEDFRRESNIMKKLQHKNLVALYGVCIEPLLIVTELAKHGNLLEFFKKAEGRLVYKDLIMMGSNVASGMAYLERNGYVHRDLAARNVLVHKERPITCKIGDFGLARKMTQENLYDAHQGAKFPIKWTAPEAATKNVFTTKSDVWSFGILFYEICTKGRTPYAGMSNADVLREVEKGYRMPKLDCIEPKSYEIMSNCWRPEANKRPTFEALQHILDDYYTSNDDANYNDDVR